ncbi:MAG: TIGR02588 family protein [Elainella sp.]
MKRTASLGLKSAKSSNPARSKFRRWMITAEQITFGIAAAIVATLVGLILLTWALQKNEPPRLSITSAPIEQRQDQFYVPFTVENQGGGTAESVQVLAELRQGQRVLQTGEQQIEFLSSGEQEEGAFIFTQDPRRFSLDLRVASYKLP